MIKFFVPGTPATAGSKKGFYNKKLGRVIMAPASDKQQPWMAMVAAAARREYNGPLLEGAIRLSLQFHHLRPKNQFNSKGEHNSKATMYRKQRPDGSKMQRAIEDALTGVIWRDDAQVAKWVGEKIYVDRDPGVFISIEEIKKIDNFEQKETEF